jgi:hypothetical protein
MAIDKELLLDNLNKMVNIFVATNNLLLVLRLYA